MRFTLFGVLALAVAAGLPAADQADPAHCRGDLNATASGAVQRSICCSSYTDYNYIEGTTTFLMCSEEGPVEYAVSINLDAARGPFTGVGTFDCGIEKPGLITLSLYEDGALVEGYRSLSGTITVSEIDHDRFAAEFDVSMEVWGDGDPVLQLRGLVSK